MMFNMKRNQVIITALVVMIAVAGYLNYVDHKQETEMASLLLSEDGDFGPLVVDDLGNIDDSSLTNTSVTSDDTNIALTPDDTDIIVDSTDVTEITDVTDVTDETAEENLSDTGSAIFVNSNIDDFFLQAKLVREQDRAKQREILTDMINNENLTADQKSNYANEMLDIQKRVEKESAAEAMIEAKGFKEVYVRIDDSTVDVVVGKETLTDSEIAQIEDIIKRKTGMETTQIRISTIKR